MAKPNGGNRPLSIPNVADRFDSLPPPFLLALRVLLRRICLAPLGSGNAGTAAPDDKPPCGGWDSRQSEPKSEPAVAEPGHPFDSAQGLARWPDMWR